MKKSMILLWVLLLVCMSCSKEEQASEETFERQVARVTAAAGLNMRAEPSLDAPVLFVVPPQELVPVLGYEGDTFTVEEKTGRWANIRFNNASGWVFSGFLELTGPQAADAATPDVTASAAEGAMPPWIFSSQGLGPIRLGEPVSEAVFRQIGQPDSVTSPDETMDSGALFWGDMESQGVVLLVKLSDGNDPENVYSIYAEAPAFRTDKGVGVGSSLHDLQQAYPAGTRSYDEYYDTDVYAAGNLRFRLYDNTVDMVSVFSQLAE